MEGPLSTGPTPSSFDYSPLSVLGNIPLDWGIILKELNLSILWFGMIYCIRIRRRGGIYGQVLIWTVYYFNNHYANDYLINQIDN